MNTFADRLRQMAAKADEEAAKGKETAEVVKAGADFTPDTIINLRRRAIVDKDTAELFRTLEDARRKAESDPIVRRSVLEQEIELLHNQDMPDIGKFFILVTEASERKLPNGEPAAPLFHVVSRDAALAWDKLRLVMPKAYFDDRGRVVHKGLDWLVPASQADSKSLLYLRDIKERCYESLMSDLENEVLPNIPRALMHGIYFVGLGSVMLAKYFSGEFDLVKEGERLAKRKPERARKTEKSGAYETFTDRGMTFYAPKTQKSTAFIDALENAKARLDNYWRSDAHRRVMSDLIVQLKEGGGELISPSHFLSGLAGVTAIECHNWKVRGRTSHVMVLLEREFGTDRWRWIYANPAAVHGLFRGGEMAFHEWTASKLTSEVEMLLRRSKTFEPLDPVEADDAPSTEEVKAAE